MIRGDTEVQAPPSPSAEGTRQRMEPAADATIEVHLDGPQVVMDQNIYGHFLESNFFGNIEGGVFDEGSPLARPGRGPDSGLREDVIDLCRELRLPIVRWPGGNFTSAYHWQDGIGPRESRPRRLELAWGGEESNRFGTDEFLAWCQLVGTEPYLAHSARDPEELARWVEYTNHAGDTAFSRLRAANGHADAYGVRYWGVGNEVYGPWQMGHRSAGEYAAAAREHARFMRVVDPGLTLIAVGNHRGGGEAWTRPLLERAGRHIDYISTHLYGVSLHLASGDDWSQVVAQPLYFERELERYGALVAGLAEEIGIDRPLSLALDEWNMRHLEPDSWPEPQPGADGGAAERDLPDVDIDLRRLRVNRWSPRTLADALFYAGVFHGLHRLAGTAVPPRMANAVNLLNANGVIVARPHGSLRTAIYHVWDLYQNHLGDRSVPVDVYGPSRRLAVRQGAEREPSGAFAVRGEVLPLLDAIATTRHGSNGLQIAVINRDKATPIRALVNVVDERGTPFAPARMRVCDIGVGQENLFASNTFSSPDSVSLVDRGTVVTANGAYVFGPHSVTLLEFELARGEATPS